MIHVLKFIFLPLALATVFSKGWASTQTFATSPAELALSETVPTAIAPDGFKIEDFYLEWDTPALGGVDLRLQKESLQWVRVWDVLVIPRGRLEIKAQGIESGVVSHAGFSQPFTVSEGTGIVEIPLALISGASNALDIYVQRNGKQLHGKISPRFKPQDPQRLKRSRLYTDPSCSPYRVNPEMVGEGKEINWIYMGCRLVYSAGQDHRTSSLEVIVFWDGVAQQIKVGGASVSATSLSVWPLRTKASGSPIELENDQDRIKIHYRIAEDLHLLTLGAGIGPYGYTFDAPQANTDTLAPLLTIYANYFLTESLRIVAFDATPISDKYYTDFGLYLNTEYIRIFDQRLIINLMLGAHVIAFKAKEKMNYQFGGPQGAELIWRDALFKGYNLSAGAFIYPTIQGKSYYNAWIRYGAYGYFAEFNFISWQERLESDRVFSRAMGISLGMPIARLF